MRLILILSIFLFLFSCHKEDIVPIKPKVSIDIFTQTETTISNGDQIMFKLTSDSTYVLKLVDKTTNQVISKEKIIGKIGENKINIYTKSIQSKYLYLVLEDGNKKEINKLILTFLLFLYNILFSFYYIIII